MTRGTSRDESPQRNRQAPAGIAGSVLLVAAFAIFWFGVFQAALALSPKMAFYHQTGLRLPAPLAWCATISLWFADYWWIAVLAFAALFGVAILVTYWVRHRQSSVGLRWVWGVVLIAPPVFAGETVFLADFAASRQVFRLLAAQPPPDLVEYFESIEQFQFALTKARNLAIESGHPRGVRVQPAGDGRLATRVVEIEQPDPFAEGHLVGSRGGSTVTVRSGDRITLFPDVAPGDSLEIPGDDVVYAVRGVAGDRLELAAPLTRDIRPPAGIGGPANYRIYRRARPVAGAEPRDLPDVSIAVRAGGLRPVSDGAIEILFAPTGQLIGESTGVDTELLSCRGGGPFPPKEVIEIRRLTGTVSVRPDAVDP